MYNNLQQIYFNRRPNDSDWRLKWNQSLEQQQCSGGNSVCIEHYTKNDYIQQKSGKVVLKKFAVPSIFTQSIDVQNPEIDDDCSSHLENLGADIPTFCGRCDEMKIEAAARENSLNEIICAQSDQIKKLTEELNKFKQSKLAVFSQNANGVKVRFYL